MPDKGSWVIHDGAHMPPHGSTVQVEFDSGAIRIGVVDHYEQTHIESFLWCGDPVMMHVVRYRIVIDSTMPPSLEISTNGSR